MIEFVNLGSADAEEMKGEDTLSNHLNRSIT